MVDHIEIRLLVPAMGKDAFRPQTFPLLIPPLHVPFAPRFVEQAHVAAVKQFGHELARLETIEAEGLDDLARGHRQSTALRRGTNTVVGRRSIGIEDERHEGRNALGKHAKKRSQVDRIPAGRHGVEARSDVRVVIGVVLSDHLDNDADSNGECAAAREHILDEVSDAGHRYQLSSERVRTDAGLFVLGRVGRDGNDRLQEIPGGGLRRSRVVRGDVRQQDWNEVVRV